MGGRPLSPRHSRHRRARSQVERASTHTVGTLLARVRVAGAIAVVIENSVLGKDSTILFIVALHLTARELKGLEQ